MIKNKVRQEHGGEVGSSVVCNTNLGSRTRPGMILCASSSCACVAPLPCAWQAHGRVCPHPWAHHYQIRFLYPYSAPTRRHRCPHYPRRRHRILQHKTMGTHEYLLYIMMQSASYLCFERHNTIFRNCMPRYTSIWLLTNLS